MDYLIALAPPILIGIAFYFLVKTLINSDRSERSAQSRIDEAVQDALKKSTSAQLRDSEDH